MASKRIEVQRTIAADPAAIFRLRCDPKGHVVIDSSGMLMDASGKSAHRSATSTAMRLRRSMTALSSPRTMTGRPSTRSGRKLGSSRSSQMGHFGPLSESLPER
jgi:hypothetical protein